jgi:hypothetical protein
MDLYTLTDTFLPDDPVDEFVSAIWTERYSTAGDVQLVVPATRRYMEQLADGRYLALRGSKEVMTLETQSIEKGLMTVVGNSLVTFLNQRYAWYPTNAPLSGLDQSQWIADYTETAAKAGEFIANVVLKNGHRSVAAQHAWRRIRHLRPFESRLGQRDHPWSQPWCGGYVGRNQASHHAHRTDLRRHRANRLRRRRGHLAVRGNPPDSIGAS